MRFFALVLICLLSFSASVHAAYNFMPLSVTDSKSPSFRLGASNTETQVAPSNVGIIGIKYLHKQGEMSTVIAVYPNTPAEKAGIQVGDRIMSVDATNITAFDADQVFGMIAGRPGDPVSLEVLRCAHNYGSYRGCDSFVVSLVRVDMNYIASDNVFRVYKYGI